MFKKILLILAIILVALGFYYREYIPTTRSDFENLYSFLTEKDLGGSSSSPISETIQTESTQDISTPKETATINTNDNIVTENTLTQDNQNSNPTPKPDTNLPEKVTNFVPFTPQAPFANWDKFHEEACEEASLAIAHYYLDKRNVVFANEAEKDIQYIGSKSKGGGMEDLNVSELKTVAKNLYGYKNWRVIDKPSIKDVEKELAQGNIIIIPLAGREIGNPYFTTPGPLYHMLVISGYDNKKGVFITQDPGTKRGKDYEYKFDILLKANHDFPGDKDKIDQGQPKILIVVK